MIRLLAEFSASEPVVAAIFDLQARGVSELEAYSPYPSLPIEQALAIGRSPIPFFAFGAALVGGSGAYLLQWWMNAYDYPLNVGGRPAHMPVAFVPVTFELAVLSAALTAFAGVLLTAGLLRLWHPVFETAGFESASVDRFWLSAEIGPEQDPEAITAALLACGALRVERNA